MRSGSGKPRHIMTFANKAACNKDNYIQMFGSLRQTLPNSQSNSIQNITINMRIQMLVSALTLLFIPAYAQFQFFEQMFGGAGGHHQQAQPQNMASDSAWYQQQYEAGTLQLSVLSPAQSRSTNGECSSLRQILMPSHSILRTLPAPLPVRFSQRRG